MNIEININAEDIKKLSQRIAGIDPVRQGRAIVNCMNNAVNLMESRVKSNVSNRILRRRTGLLANSISSRVVASSDGLIGYVGVGLRSGKKVKYARILEEGGVIRAKNAPYLMFQIHTSTRIYSKAGKRLKRAQANYSWVRVKQVTIPAFKYLATSAEQMRDRIFRIFNATITRELSL